LCPKKVKSEQKLPSPGFLAQMLPIPQPRGRPRKDCYWCTLSGAWKPIQTQQPSRPLLLSTATTGQHVRIFPAATILVEDPLEKERRCVEEEKRMRLFKEESARQSMLEAARARAVEAKRTEEERLAYPRRYASSLRDCDTARVYYFDTHGDFQELGKERERPRLVCSAPAKKRVRMTYDKWVYGPSEKHQLAEGESELVTVTEWVWRKA